jgi:hypothetical protein
MQRKPDIVSRPPAFLAEFADLMLGIRSSGSCLSDARKRAMETDPLGCQLCARPCRRRCNTHPRAGTGTRQPAMPAAGASNVEFGAWFPPDMALCAAAVPCSAPGRRCRPPAGRRRSACAPIRSSSLVNRLQCRHCGSCAPRRATVLTMPMDTGDCRTRPARRARAAG